MRSLLLLTLLQLSNCKKSVINTENEIFEKTEISLKFPLFALKIPPTISARKAGSKVSLESVTCNSFQVKTSIDDLRKKVQCVPRETVVKIEAPTGYSNLTPNMVIVKRCNGICSNGKKCLPTEQTKIDFFVRAKKSGMTYCNKIKILEDTKCKCNCPRKKCTSINHKFDPNTCKCLCRNKDDEINCQENSNNLFTWNSTSCSCGCRAQKICTTGSEWSTEECRCIKIINNYV